jgi:DNA-binding CsgD family transcriptional regulator
MAESENIPTVSSKFLNAMRESPDPIFAIDRAQKILLWTAAMVRLTGWSAEEAEGNFCFATLAGSDTFGNAYCSPNCPVKQTLDQNKVVNPFELILQNRKDQKRHRVRCNHVLMVSQEKGEPQICVYMLEDLDQVQSSSESTKKPLSKREIEILRALSQGMDNRAIASALHLSESTIRNHIQNIFNKLGVHSRVEAVVRAYKEKLV